MCVLSQRDPILLWNEMKVSFQEPSSATCFWVPVESSNANSPSGFIPCRSAPGCPGPCPPAGRPSGLADYSVDRTRMGWNTRGPRCHSRDCAGGRQVRPFLSPSRIRNKVSRAASQSLRVSDPLVAHGDYLRKGPRGKNVVAVVKDRGDSQREQEIIEKGAFWGCTRCLRWDADLTPDPWHPQVGTAWLSGYQALAERKKWAIRSAQLSCYDFFHKPISNLELRVLWQDDVLWWAVSFKGDQEAPRKFWKMVFQHKLLTTSTISVLTFNLWHSPTRDRELHLLYEVQRTPQMSFLPFLRLLPSVHPLNRGTVPSFQDCEEPCPTYVVSNWVISKPAKHLKQKTLHRLMKY